MNSSDTSHPEQLAATVVSGGMPQPDCAPDGCKRLRIIDGLAEEARAAAIAAQPAQQDSAADAAPADSSAASAPAEAAPAQAAPIVISQ